MKAKDLFSKEKERVPETAPRLNAPFISMEALKGISLHGASVRL
jgi:hypothetical protein